MSLSCREIQMLLESGSHAMMRPSVYCNSIYFCIFSCSTFDFSNMMLVYNVGTLQALVYEYQIQWTTDCVLKSFL